MSIPRLPLKTRLTLTCAVAALALIGHAGAGDHDTASVRIKTAGADETVEVALHTLKVGESRQLVAASGKPAVVTRTEDGLTVEVAGQRTEVAFPNPDNDIHVFHTGDGEHAGKKVRVLRLDRTAEVSDVGDGQRKIVVVRSGSADASDLDEAGVAVLVEKLKASSLDGDDAEIAELIAEIQAKAGAAGEDGKQVIVTRRIGKSAD